MYLEYECIITGKWILLELTGSKITQAKKYYDITGGIIYDKLKNIVDKNEIDSLDNYSFIVINNFVNIVKCPYIFLARSIKYTTSSVTIHNISDNEIMITIGENKNGYTYNLCNDKIYNTEVNTND